MPTVFTHAVVALGAARVLHARPQPRRLWLLTALCAILPDFDAVTFKLGIPYASMWGHRGFTHSVAFALLTGLVVAGIGWRQAPRSQWWQRAGWLALATLSHPLLDMLTNGGLGVALWAPLSAERYFFPVHPVRVSPIGGGFFSARGVATMLSEFTWLWLPTALAVVVARLAKKRKPG
ncbi:metal-dependent hydrolase [Hymenobacter sp. BT175]|uniref:metal-dependent hydrolase n=1 Tax=Hymenobacter translucens TaxID=2886507 RepID=UPI001D0E2241|nr:metal-dependent hydrolase [Hymenobacter translucens]MCC2548639.1 metal-dependent hydrolase [Hymenobacter translucens]